MRAVYKTGNFVPRLLRQQGRVGQVDTVGRDRVVDRVVGGAPTNKGGGCDGHGRGRRAVRDAAF